MAASIEAFTWGLISALSLLIGAGLGLQPYWKPSMRTKSSGARIRIGVSIL